MLSTRTLFYIMGLVISIAFSSWYYVHRNHLRATNQLPDDHYDYYAKDVSYKAFDPKGRINRDYKTSYLYHYQRKNITNFAEPIFTIYPTNNPPWTITAKYGQAEQNDEMITLTKNVRISQPAKGKSPDSLIVTENLTFFPKHHFASTDSIITYHQPGSTIQAQGMRAFLDQQRIQLISNTRGHYEKPMA